MRKTKISLILAAGLTVTTQAAFASAWDLALDATESARLRASQPEKKLPVTGVISSEFGLRRHPITEQVKLHKGIDIAADEGTDFHSTSIGRVTYAGRAGGLGLMVEVKGVDGTVTRFGHASALAVKVGDRVHKGVVLGQVGSTGVATGSHLHYELLVNGRNVDPRGSDLTALLAKANPFAKEARLAKEESHNTTLIATLSQSRNINLPKGEGSSATLKPTGMIARLVPFQGYKTKAPETNQFTAEINVNPRELIDLNELNDSISEFVKQTLDIA